MCKKIGIVALAVVAGLFLLNKTNLGSYARTAWNKVKIGANESVPLEFEIERVKNEVSQLVPDMRDNLKLIAQETVAVENLREEVKVAKANLAEQKKKILVMKQDLASGAKFVNYNDREIPAGKVRDRLARDWESYKVAERSLETKEKVLEAKETALLNAHDQLTSLRSKKEQLELQVAELEAELKAVRVAEAKSNFQLDDSRLSKINASLANIRDRIKVAKKHMELESQFAQDVQVPVEKKIQQAELLKDIDDHFGKGDEVAGK